MLLVWGKAGSATRRRTARIVLLNFTLSGPVPALVAAVQIRALIAWWVKEVAPDLLLDHVRRLRAQDPARASEEGLELGVGGLVLPSLVVGRGQRGSRASRRSVMAVTDRDLHSLIAALAFPICRPSGR